MPTLIVMDRSGDTRTEFDANDAVAVAAAEARFKELTGLGFTPAARGADGKAKVVRSFDPTAPETLLFPRLQGG
jgi:hypothetical protein